MDTFAVTSNYAVLTRLLARVDSHHDFTAKRVMLPLWAHLKPLSESDRTREIEIGIWWTVAHCHVLGSPTEVAEVFIEARDIQFRPEYHQQVPEVRELIRRALVTGLKKGYARIDRMAFECAEITAENPDGAGKRQLLDNLNHFTDYLVENKAIRDPRRDNGSWV
ncbi:hypothetical protein SLS62_007826 [Diatrype stigma]|uniref:Uncharacterized protein n=1 Tax=Diatrype stigma TaxID=117547 RepID=A0AAN9YPX4_9PEZI